MAKLFKLILIGFVTIAVGLSLATVGYLNHGANSIQLRHGRFFVPQEAKVHEKLTSFSKINIAANAINVNIKRDNSISKPKIIARVDDSDDFTYEVNNGTLVVKYAQNGDYTGVGFGSSGSTYITVLLPRQMSLKDIQLTGNDSGVILKQVTVAKLTANLTYSGLRLQQVNADKVITSNKDSDLRTIKANIKNLQTTSHGGDVKLERSQIANFDGDLEDGNVDIDRTTVSGDNKVMIADGNIKFTDATISTFAANLQESDVAMNRTTFTGKNTISIQDGDVSGGSVHVTGIEARISDGDLTVLGKKYVGHYQKNENAKDNLVLTVVDGDIALN